MQIAPLRNMKSKIEHSGGAVSIRDVFGSFFLESPSALEKQPTDRTPEVKTRKTQYKIWNNFLNFAVRHFQARTRPDLTVKIYGLYIQKFSIHVFTAN